MSGFLQSQKIKRLASGALAALFLALQTPLGVLGSHVSAQTLTSTKEISAKALDDHECDATKWHFVITQVEPEANAPANITVNWANSETAAVPLDAYTGKTAHYATTLNLDSTVTSATAQIYSEWDGQFNLSHGPCPAATGSLKVDKEVDTNGDGTFEGGNVAANLLGFRWGYDATAPARLMGTTASDVPVGPHTVTENTVNGYVFVGWYYNTNTDPNTRSCNNPRGTTLPVDVEVKENVLTRIILCNKKVVTPPTPGSITIVKDAQPNALRDFDFEIKKVPTTVGFRFEEDFKLDDDAGVPGATNVLSHTKTFDDLKAGTYTVTEDMVPGWKLKNIVCSQGATVVRDGQKVTITLHAGEDVTCTFVNIKTATLTIVKDARPNHEQDFTFTSTAVTTVNPGLGTFVLDDDSDSTLSNQKQFSGLRPGYYRVSEEAVAGWKLKDIVCTGGTWYVNGATVTVKLEAGDNVTCTFTNKKLSNITGVKFEDVNGNGVLDAGEPGLGDWTITISTICNSGNSLLTTLLSSNNGCGSSFNSSTQTASDGSYAFNDLKPGRYLVCEVLKDGWKQTFPATSSGCHDLVVGHGQDVVANFGNFKLATISGFKFNDQDNSASFNDSEAKLSGWQITLHTYADAAGTILSAPIATTVTDANGNYSFTGLAKGIYVVCETPQSGWAQTFPTTSNGCHQVTVNTSGQAVTANFGNRQEGGRGGGQVLGTTTTVQPALVDTGSSILANMFASLALLGILGAVTYASKKQYS